MSPDAWKILFGTVLGSILAFLGGIFGEYLKIRIHSKREREYISVTLSDELTEICDIISKFSETFDKTGNAVKSYLVDLKSSMDSYNNQRDRLFIFKDEDTRKSIHQTYKDLKNLINDAESKVGTLADTVEAKSEQKEIVQKFIAVADKTRLLKQSLTTKKKRK